MCKWFSLLLTMLSYLLWSRKWGNGTTSFLPPASLWKLLCSLAMRADLFFANWIICVFLTTSQTSLAGWETTLWDLGSIFIWGSHYKYPPFTQLLVNWDRMDAACCWVLVPARSAEGCLPCCRQLMNEDVMGVMLCIAQAPKGQNTKFIVCLSWWSLIYSLQF